MRFVFLLTICLMLIWGISQTDAVRLRTDPQFRIQTELNAHPVYSTIKRLAPSDHEVLDDFLTFQMLQGVPLSEAFLLARPLLTKLTDQQLGFADQKSKLDWGRVTVDTLKELKAVDPLLCYTALSSRPLDSQTLLHAFSENNTKTFQQTIIDVYDFSDHGSKHKSRERDNTSNSFNDVAHVYHSIKETIAHQFGENISRELERKALLELPMEPPEEICSARIIQLESMLLQQQAMAARLIDSTLRTDVGYLRTHVELSDLSWRILSSFPRKNILPPPPPNIASSNEDP